MLPNPHDGIFKAVLGQPEHARGMLRAILPPVLTEALDWQTLTLRPGSFVDAALTHQHTDLLYSVMWRDGTQALVYLLFEHQSTSPTEGLMALRLLGYQDRIWQRWRTDHPKSKTLPMIIPIVMYHGVTPWSEPRAFDALLDVPPDLRPAVEPYLVRFTYVLHDLSKISDDDLREGAMYTALAKLVAQALLEREIGPETKDTIMTAGQQIFEQGIKEGIKEGIERGIVRSLINIYEARFGAMPEEIRAVIEATHDEPTLLTWLTLAGTRGVDEITAAIRASRPN